MQKIKSFGIVLIALLLAAPALAGDQSGMAERLKTWQAAYNAADAEAVAAHYTEDAARLPYQATTFTGREAIAANTVATHEMGAVKIELALLGGESQGNLAWAHGTYHLMTADGATFQKGKWMNVSKKVGKEWLIAADIWNTDAPEE